jgi:hypothetical protein
MLQRVARLRAVTAPQAHALVELLARTSLRNAYARLATLVRNGFLRMEPVWPERGRYSAFYYQLAHAGLRAVRREKDRNLLARPPQHVLEYLLLRNDVYAAARRDGWIVASPLLTRSDLHATALETFRTWALETKRAEIRDMQVRGRHPVEVARALQELERLPRFLPSTFNFEYLARRGGSGRVGEMALLIVDDPRRAVRRQAANLPSRAVLVPGLRLVLRDSESRFDLASRVLYRPSSRLRTWRRTLAAHYGEEFLATDTLWPDVWAHRVGAPLTAPLQQQETST